MNKVKVSYFGLFCLLGSITFWITIYYTREFVAGFLDRSFFPKTWIIGLTLLFFQFIAIFGFSESKKAYKLNFKNFFQLLIVIGNALLCLVPIILILLYVLAFIGLAIGYSKT